jgi:hypothetical protein
MEKEFRRKQSCRIWNFFLTIIRGTLGPRAISNLEITGWYANVQGQMGGPFAFFLTNEFADLAADRVASFLLKDIFIADLASGIEC